MPIVGTVAEPIQGTATWMFQFGGGLTAWDWSGGAVNVRDLDPVRRTRSGALSRHGPVQGFCSTTGSVLSLESGLELELMLLLDRRPDVKWELQRQSR